MLVDPPDKATLSLKMKVLLWQSDAGCPRQTAHATSILLKEVRKALPGLAKQGPAAAFRNATGSSSVGANGRCSKTRQTGEPRAKSNAQRLRRRRWAVVLEGRRRLRGRRHAGTDRAAASDHRPLMGHHGPLMATSTVPLTAALQARACAIMVIFWN